MSHDPKLFSQETNVKCQNKSDDALTFSTRLTHSTRQRFDLCYRSAYAACDNVSGKCLLGNDTHRYDNAQLGFEFLIQDLIITRFEQRNEWFFIYMTNIFVSYNYVPA